MSLDEIQQCIADGFSDLADTTSQTAFFTEDVLVVPSSAVHSEELEFGGIEEGIDGEIIALKSAFTTLPDVGDGFLMNGQAFRIEIIRTDDEDPTITCVYRLMGVGFSVSLCTRTGGTLATTQTSGVSGDIITLTFTPDDSYVIDVFSVNGTAYAPTSTNTLTWTLVEDIDVCFIATIAHNFFSGDGASTGLFGGTVTSTLLTGGFEGDGDATGEFGGTVDSAIQTGGFEGDGDATGEFATESIEATGTAAINITATCTATVITPIEATGTAAIVITSSASPVTSQPSTGTADIVISATCTPTVIQPIEAVGTADIVITATCTATVTNP